MTGLSNLLLVLFYACVPVSVRGERTRPLSHAPALPGLWSGWQLTA
jgi:hypothetical protein